jgi:hypothetical protein
MEFHDRRMCRDFVYRVVAELDAADIPLLWHYLAYRDERVFACFNDDVRPTVRALVDAWLCLLPIDRRDVLAHFALVLEELARRVAAGALLPKEDDE